MSNYDRREYVFRYDQHMPETDDLALTVLKGHLLVEEVLFELAGLALPHPQYIDDARLGFHKLACVVRAAVPQKSDDPCWQLVLKLNSVRNAFAHNLEPPNLQTHLQQLFTIDEQVQTFEFEGMTIDKSGDSSLDDHERLRQVVVSCMEFLLGLIFEYKNAK